MSVPPKTRTRDPRFDLLRVLACFGVLFLHATGAVARDPSLDGDVFCCLVLHSLFRGAAMPVFFMTSGRFLLDRLAKSDLDKAEVQAFYAKRARRVWLPTLLWSLFYVVVAVLYRSLDGAPTSWRETCRDWLLFGKPGAGYHMWFLYVMFALDLAAPYLARATRRFSARALCFFAFLSLAVFAVVTTRSIMRGGSGQSEIIVWALAFGYAPYYVLGWLVSKLENANERRLRNVRRASLAAYLLSTAGLFWTTYAFGVDYARNEFLPLAVLQTLAAFAYFAARPISTNAFDSKFATLVERLAGLTFGVYLVHVAVMPIATRVLERAVCLSPASEAIAVAFITALASGLVVAVMKKLPYVKRLV